MFFLFEIFNESYCCFLFDFLQKFRAMDFRHEKGQEPVFFFPFFVACFYNVGNTNIFLSCKIIFQDFEVRVWEKKKDNFIINFFKIYLIRLSGVFLDVIHSN
ncbi:hypothetical protein AMTRI_Chr02g213080 [Amborella trichopoda]